MYAIGVVVYGDYRVRGGDLDAVLPLRIIPLRSIQVVVHSFHHTQSLPNCSTIKGHFGCFQFGDITGKAISCEH